ncbi:MAG: hypothetical protein U0929_20695 [Planctomycetaceae bacterium]
MNRSFLIIKRAQLQPGRHGATLVEVLMALLIMAVGVTSVVTLFPLAILKAVRAHQLTDAKLFENSIKDTLLTHSQLWTGAPEWTESTMFGRTSTTASVQDRWVTPKRTERLVPDTNQLFYVGSNSLSLPQSSGARDPGFSIGSDWSAALRNGGYENFNTVATRPAATIDGGLEWVPYRHSPYLADSSWTAYVVDPLGWHNAESNAERVQFGQIPTGALPYGDSSGAANTRKMDRIHCQLSLDTANELFRLQDTWSLAVEPTALDVSPAVTFPAANTVQVEFPAKIDATGLIPGKSRVILSSTQSRRVVTVPVTVGTSNPSPNILRIPNTPNSTIPTGFDAIVDQASVEVQSPSRYSWLMAVHSSPQGKFEAQCAVVLNRTFQAADEQGYRAEFCVSEDLDNDGVLSAAEDSFWPNGRIDTNVAKIRWPYNPDVDSPRIREGGYILDASHGYWYQVKKVEKVDDEAMPRVDGNQSGATADVLKPDGDYVRVIVSLNDQVKVGTGDTSNGATAFTNYKTAGGFDCQAVILPGVIHVFSMTPESPQ